MHTSHELIELAKQRLALKYNLELPVTDYRLAKLFGLRPQTVSGWKMRGRIDSDFGPKFAEVCELPEEYVYACLEHEREKNPSVLRVLESIAQTFAKGHAAALAIVAILALSGMPEKQAFAADSGANFGGEKYTLCAKRRRRCRAAHKGKTRENLTKFPPMRPNRARRRILSLPAPATLACARNKE